MQLANPARVLPQGLSWFGRTARRVPVALLALLMAATMAAAGMSAGEPTAAAGDDTTVVAGASWSTTRSLLRMPGGGFDMLGGS